MVPITYLKFSMEKEAVVRRDGFQTQSSIGNLRELGANVESLQKLLTQKVVFSQASLAFEQDRSIKSPMEQCRLRQAAIICLRVVKLKSSGKIQTKCGFLCVAYTSIA